MPDKLVVAGAGPAGAALAFYAGEKGYDVHVYDPAPFPGFKPCGWAIPSLVSRYLRLPPETILAEIKGFRVYLNGVLVHEQRGTTWGYIVDKPALLRKLLVYAGLKRSHVRLICSNGRVVAGATGASGELVVAVGPVLPRICGRRDFIYAVQYVDNTVRLDDPNIVEVHYDGGLIGYYWVFPRGERGVDIGVGGYEPAKSLVERLIRFAAKRFGLKVEASKIRGAPIYIGGPEPDLLDGKPPVIGEAAGLVYPLSGEGIRPSIASAYALLESLEKGGKPSKKISRIIRWMRIQKLILERAVKSSRETRERILRSLPLDLFVGLGLGELTTTQLVKLAAYMPASIAKILLARSQG